MRTIYVTGGRTDYAVGTLTETTGKDLASATIKATVTTTKTPPAKTDPSWETPILEGTGAVRVVRLLLDEDNAPPGLYWLWADYADNPTSQPVLANNMQIRTI